MTTSLIYIVSNYDSGNCLTDPYPVSTDKLKQVLASHVHVLSREDLPLDCDGVNTKYLSINQKTLYVQKAVTVSKQQTYAIYTYELHPAIMNAVAVYHWIEKKIRKYENDSRRPLYYILCKGMRHFERQGQIRAVSILQESMSSYFESVRNMITGKPSASFSFQDTYELFRQIYFPDLQEPLREIDSTFYDLLKNLYGPSNVKWVNFEFDNRLRMVFLYEVDTNNLVALSEFVRSHQGAFIESHKKRANHHYVIGPSYGSLLLGNSQYTANLNQPLCDLADLQRRLVGTSAARMNFEKTILGPIQHLMAYHLTGAWVNIEPQMVDSNAPAWTIASRLEKNIQQSQRSHPYTVPESLKLILEYVTLRRFLHYYDEFQSNQALTLQSTTNQIDYIRSQFVRKTATLESKDQRDSLYNSIVLPWSQDLVDRYQKHHRQSPFVVLLDEYHWNIDALEQKKKNTPAMSESLFQYEKSLLEKNYGEKYWSMLLNVWIRLQQLHLQCEKYQLTTAQYRQRQDWISQMVTNDFVQDPRTMEDYIKTDFSRFRTFSFLHNYLPAFLADPLLNQYKKNVQRLLIPPGTVNISPLESLQRATQAVTFYRETENQILQKLLSFTVENPAPVFVDM